MRIIWVKIFILLANLGLLVTDKANIDVFPFYFENNKWGFIDKDFKEIIHPIYDDVTFFKFEKAVVKKGDYCGLINKKNEILMPIIYDIITIFNENIIVGMKDHISFLFHSKDNSIKKIPYETIGLWNDKIIIMADINNKVILYNITTSQLIKTDFDDIVCPKATFNFGDQAYNETAEILYNNSNLNKDIAIIVSHKKVGYINDDGSILIEPKYDFAFHFQNNIGIVKVGNYWGIINFKGEYIIKPKFESIFNDNTVTVEKENDIKDIAIFQSKVEYFGRNYINHGFIYVKKNNKWGVIDTNGKEIIKPKFIDGFSFFGNYGFIIKSDTIDEDSADHKTEVIDKNGNVKFKTKFNQCRFMSDTLFWFIKDNNFGIMHYSGKIIWEMEGIFVTAIEKGAIIKINGNYCIINSEGNFIEKTNFSRCIFPITEHDDFYHFSFRNNDSLVCFDVYGKRLFKLVGDYKLSYFPNKGNELMFYKNDSLGIVNKKGEIIIESKYKEITKISDHFYFGLLYNDGSNQIDDENVKAYLIQGKSNKRSVVIKKIPGNSFLSLLNYLKNNHLIHEIY
ncbi:MAG TPA: WG repeat-containing protein [Candidatus Kapabacteria bacterium]|nr:WG repeat-containing protein [Candidatus Kapabacteria bacterium]